VWTIYYYFFFQPQVGTQPTGVVTIRDTLTFAHPVADALTFVHPIRDTLYFT